MENKNNIPIAVDPTRKNFIYYSNVTLFKPNFKEFCEGMRLVKVSKNKDILLTLGSKLQDKQHISMLLLTMSESGVFYSKQNNNGQFDADILPAQIRNIADVSGAGDTVISIAALCLALGLQAADIAFISNIAGGLVCEEVGVIPVKKQRLMEELLTFAK